jgi:hypothetical protein
MDNGCNDFIQKPVKTIELITHPPKAYQRLIPAIFGVAVQLVSYLLHIFMEAAPQGCYRRWYRKMSEIALNSSPMRRNDVGVLPMEQQRNLQLPS